MPLAILHRDASLAVIDKPSGLVVHRGWADDAETVLDLAREALGAPVFPLHRLDRGTSGALALALTEDAARAMGRAFEAGAIDKTYWALVRGLAPEAGIVDHPVPRTEGGARVDAVTEYRRLAAIAEGPGGLRGASLVEARPRTGRFHQVRRHMKHLGCPLLGDANYGRGDLNRAYRDAVGLARLALHAARLCFAHPVTGERVDVRAPMPADLAGPLERLGFAPAVWEPAARDDGGEQRSIERFGSSCGQH
jgi:tRNA pseudouridine65 synthase